MKRKKEDYFIIGLALTLVIVVLFISIILAQQRKTEPKVQTLTPIPTSTQIVDQPPVLYDRKAQDTLLERKINRTPLNNADKIAKAKLLTLLPPGQISGVIHETSIYKVDYVQAFDLFKVEILTTDVAKAKSQANVWLRAQGLSQKGICDLPLGFYLNWDIASQLRNTSFNFNPLPNGC